MKALFALFVLFLGSVAHADICTVVIRDQDGYEYDSFASSSYSTTAACDDASWECRQTLSDYQSNGRHIDAFCSIKVITPSHRLPRRPRRPREPRYPRFPQPREPQFPRDPDEPRFPREPSEPQFPRDPDEPRYPREPSEPRYPREPSEPRYPREPREPGREPPRNDPGSGPRRPGPRFINAIEIDN